MPQPLAPAQKSELAAVGRGISDHLTAIEVGIVGDVGAVKRVFDYVDGLPAERRESFYADTYTTRHAAAFRGAAREALGEESAAKGGARDSAEYARLTRLAEGGDAAALAKLKATPRHVIRSWSR